MLKSVQGVYSPPQPHWVGDGFPVRSLFSYGDHGRLLSPFLLLDHAGPHSFEPTQARRGVGVHPHKGFETVTIVYDGEVAHRDSTGAGGVIGPGDVQWMTAGDGILHEEYHSDDYARTGGPFEMVQLWVNLPARHKGDPAAYQTLLAKDIPVVELPDDAGRIRVIAGEFDGQSGPARTFTPMDVLDVRLKANHTLDYVAQPGYSLAVVVLHGTVHVQKDVTAGAGQLIIFDRKGDEVNLHASEDATLLILCGEPIQEQVVGYGPFVMNSKSEILRAFEDFQSGRFGQMPE